MVFPVPDKYPGLYETTQVACEISNDARQFLTSGRAYRELLAERALERVPLRSIFKSYTLGSWMAVRLFGIISVPSLV